MRGESPTYDADASQGGPGDRLDGLCGHELQVERAEAKRCVAGAGVDEKRKDDLHVAFSCYQVECQEDRWYGGSVGLGRCLSEDAEVILALEVSQSLPVVICVRQYQIQGPILQESLSSVSN
jgi:hypothetical protein